MCDNCKEFQMRRDGVSGRRPGKNAKSNCEIPWTIKGGINEHTSYQSIEKKRKSVEILSLYNYTVIDDSCRKESDSRLLNGNYRSNWKSDDIHLNHKSNSNSIETSDNSYPIQSKPDLGKGGTVQSKANSNSPHEVMRPPSSPDDPELSGCTVLSSQPNIASFPPTIAHQTAQRDLTLEGFLERTYPRKYKKAVKQKFIWSEDGVIEGRSNRVVSAYAKNVEDLLKVVSSSNTTLASDIVNQMLKQNSNLSYQLNSTSKTVMKSISKFISDKLRATGVKCPQEKQAMAALIQAVTYDNSDLLKHREICTSLGFHKDTFRNNTFTLYEDNYRHKKRKAKVRTQLSQIQEESIIKFSHSDESSTIDSNSRRVVKIEKEGLIEEHVGRVWCALTVDEKYLMYTKSEVVEDHFSQYGDEFVVPGRSFFHKHCCPCVRNPSMQSCVDTRISKMEHYMRAIAKYIRKHTEVRDQLTGKAWVQLLSGCAEDFIASTCCAPVLHPHLVCGIGTSRRVPSFIKWKCINSLCNECGVDKKHDISSCELLTTCTVEIELLEWKEVAIQGESGGKQNT